MKKYIFWVGLGLILGYLFWIKPPGPFIGYMEDLCTDTARQMMAENLKAGEGPTFSTRSFMTPQGISVPYVPWSIERDWLGAYFWMWKQDFPFLWFYFSVSLIFTFLGTGLLFKKMKLSQSAAWSMATALVLFHIPRHFKTWYHFELLPQHWAYLSIFVDAWIWQRFCREKEVSLEREVWRGILLMATVLGSGYFWPLLIFEWILIRLCFLFFLFRKRRTKFLVGFQRYHWLYPSAIGFVICVIMLRWFLPLWKEVQATGDVLNNLGWYSPALLPFRPLWWDLLFESPAPFYTATETVVSVGWFLLIPALLSVLLLKRAKKIEVAVPFILFLVFAYCWSSDLIPSFLFNFFRSVLPLMNYVRVSCRWSLLFPPMLGAIIVLAWPEWSRFKFKKYSVFVGIFIISSLMEGSWLLSPVKAMNPPPSDMADLLTTLKNRSGSTVLDLPFCVAGGNGYCTGAECPLYPFSTLNLCMRLFHEKKVYGIYVGRLNAASCQIYAKPPYISWFSAWRERRCFTDWEWKDFCNYLETQPDLAGVMLYPEIWGASEGDSCLQQFGFHLGPKISEAVVPLVRSESQAIAGKGDMNLFTRMILYSSKCRATQSN